LVRLGDTDATPYGGGTWASRGAGVGGEAAWQAAWALRGQLLTLAASLLQADPSQLDLRDGQITDAAGAPRMALADLARIAHFRPDTLPPGIVPELAATRHHVPRDYPFAFTNGVQGLGAALFEACRYDAAGQMTNATMADYRVPMAAEMPDIEIGHVCTPTAETALGAKGAGEAGTAAAAAAVLNAVNDALAPDAAMLTALPLTPAQVLAALGVIG
jgi:carbon-monoxide dehydrogenase large subunit